MTKEGSVHCKHPFSLQGDQPKKFTKSIKKEEDTDYLRRRRVVSLLSLAGFLVFLIVVAAVFGPKLAEFLSDSNAFRTWMEQQGVWGPISLIGIMALQVVIAIIPGEAVEIGAGYAFGAIPGMLLCLIGAAVGSVIIFGLTKLFGVRLVEAFISREKIHSLKFLQDAKRLNLLLFLLFFIPGTPKDLFTYFIGLTPMKLYTFLVLSSIARIPSVITSTIGGEALGAQNYTFAILVFAATAVISGIGLLLYRKITVHSDGKKETK